MNASTFSKLTLGALAIVALGLATPATAEDNTPRDVKSGQSSGKRQHTPASPTCLDGETCSSSSSSASSEVSSPRDAASGQATGKRMHKPLSTRSESDAQDHNSSRSNKSAVSPDVDSDNDGAAEHEVKSPRDAASGQATGKRMHKPMASPDLDSDNDGLDDASGMAINEKGMPGNTTKAKAGKTGSAK